MSESHHHSSNDKFLHRLFKVALGEKAKNVYVRIFGALLFALGAALTFVPHIFEFFRHLTEHPEILPVTLLVPYVYLIFEMVLSRLEKDEDSTEQVRLFEARLSEIGERLLERKTLVEAFNRSMKDFPEVSIAGGTNSVSEWIAADNADQIEVQILSYSSETLLDGLLEVANRLKKNRDAGIGVPKKISFKLLTRDLEAIWHLPCLFSREADDAYRRDLKGRFGQYLDRWKGEFFKAFDFLPREALALEVRWYPFEPTYKVIIVNQKIGIVGVYPFHQVKQQGVEGWDYHGQRMTMYKLGEDASPAITRNSRTTLWSNELSKNALNDFSRLFDEIWNQHAKPVEGF